MSITRLIHRGKHLYGERTALVCGQRQVTFADLYDDVRHGAAVLRELEPGNDGSVGILAQPGDRTVTLFFASAWAGMVPNYLNSRWSEHELQGALDDFRPEILVVDDTYLATGIALANSCSSIRHVLHIGENAPGAGTVIAYAPALASAKAIPDQSGTGDDLAFLNYTGGTTGKGKGVMISHAGHLAAMLTLAAEGFFQPGNTLMAVPLFHISGIAVTNSAIMLGNTQFILPGFDPEVALELIQDQKIVQALLIPTMLQMIVTHPRFDEFDLSHLRFIRYGGAPIDQTLILTVRDKLPWVNLMQVYGQTECVPATLLHDTDHSESGVASGRIRSAGTPCLGVDVIIRDDEGKPLPRGEIGEVTLKASFAMKGYLNMPEQTAATLRDGWIYTGDGGYLSSDDYLFVVDRIKDMIVSGGENVYSAEVEDIVARYPGVSQCAVVGIVDETWGERVHVEIVASPEANISDEALQQFCRDYLAGYKIPRSIRIVDSLPLTAVGKVDKVAIRALVNDNKA